MTGLSRLYRSLFARTQPGVLLVWRIALGGVSFLWLLSNLSHLSRDYALDGMMQFSMQQNPNWAWELMQVIPGHETTVFGLGFVLHLLFLANIRPRFMSFLLWSWHLFLVTLNPYAMNSEQYMFLWMFLYGSLIPWAGSKQDKAVHSMAVRLFQIHVCLIYALSTFWKIKLDPAWFNGESVYYVLMHPLWSRVAGQEWVAWTGVAPLMTYASLVLEGSFAFMIWIRNWRPFLVYSLLLFHLSLSLLMQHIGFFSMAMMASLLCWAQAEDWAWIRKARK